MFLRSLCRKLLLIFLFRMLYTTVYTHHICLHALIVHNSPSSSSSSKITIAYGNFLIPKVSNEIKCCNLTPPGKSKYKIRTWTKVLYLCNILSAIHHWILCGIFTLCSNRFISIFFVVVAVCFSLGNNE